MQRRVRDLLRTFLPLLPLGLCGAYGVINGSASGVTPAPVEVAEIPNAPPTIEIAAVEDAQVGATFDYLPDGAGSRKRHAAIYRYQSTALGESRFDQRPHSWNARPHGCGSVRSHFDHRCRRHAQVVTAPFSITVNPALEPALEPARIGSGVASLQWEVPPSKVNGEPLDDLAGYRILYGRSSSDLDHSVLITDPATTSYQFSSLTSGIWYFAVVAVSSSGLEGPPTTLASKSI